MRFLSRRGRKFALGNFRPSSSATSTDIRQGTHEVFNQARDFKDVDLYRGDRALRRCMDSMTTNFEGISGTSHEEHLKARGVLGGTEKMMHKSTSAEANVPTLRQFDSHGRRIDVVDYHDSYHYLMRDGIEGGTTNYGWTNDWRKNGDGHLVRAGLMYMQNQVEAGHCCPLVMTSAAIPVIQALQPSSSPSGTDSSDTNFWLSKLLSGQYDPSNAPIEHKAGATIGMSMTEKQGGSDVRANTTTATPLDGGRENAYSLVGHKWFTSAPMSDGFLTLAKVGDDLSAPPSCFLVPRWKPDGTRNEGFKIMRLKNKLADRANASSEVEYHNAYGVLLGEPGKGLQTILQMVQMTRLDCSLGAAAGAKRSLSIALNHTASRSAFGAPLVQQPLMQNLLTDLCVVQEACLLSAMRMAAAHARSSGALAAGAGNGKGKGSEVDREHEMHVFRVGVAILKYYCTKLQPQFAYECMEALGGNGFVDGVGSFGTARQFRHSPLNSIWEGSGNVMALDVLRAAKSLPYFLREMRIMAGAGADADARAVDPYLEKYISLLERDVMALAKSGETPEGAMMMQRGARMLVDRLAIGFQASLLVAHGHADGHAANAYIASRIRPAVEVAGVSVGANYGASAVYEPHQSQWIIDDHMPLYL